MLSVVTRVIAAGADPILFCFSRRVYKLTVCVGGARLAKVLGFETRGAGAVDDPAGNAG
jgi:hypothetical protein